MGWRDAPVLSVGPNDYITTIYAVLGVVGPDAEWAMERRLKHLTFDQLREVSFAVSKAPLGASASLAFERAMAEIPPPPPTPAA